jgi:glutamine amidotransferase
LFGAGIAVRGSPYRPPGTSESALMVALVVDAGIGNVGSILSMLRRIGHRGEAISEPRGLAPGDRLILPGVGAFDAGMAALLAQGFAAWLPQMAKAGTPILGICLGMQMLFERSAEGDGMRPGLGLMPGQVVRIRAEEHSLRLPHMGWNVARPVRDNPILPPGEEEQRFYFVHSFRVVCADPADLLAETAYGETFPSAVSRGVLFGTQFHPEKSHRFGMALLERFVTAPLDSAAG